MPSLKQLHTCCLLGSLLGGCASMQPEDPDRHAPSREMLDSIATVAVAEPQISGCHTDLS
jgi:cytochrome c556